MLFIDISIFSSGGHFVQQRKTFCAISVEGIIRNISVKLFEFWSVVQEMPFNDFSIF